jgi:5-methyltetrahydropteroyltriglutamate--homocysteine methyltransferase
MSPVKTLSPKMKPSAGTEKLRKLGIELPFYPTTSVGSFPKPPELMEARSKASKNLIPLSELQNKERRATEYWIREQEQIGIDVLVDGEMYRGDMVAYFAEHIPGFSTAGTVRSYGNRFYKKPVIAGEVSWPGPITVDWWKFAQRLTNKPVKGMLTGPYTIMDWSFNEHYPNRAAACMALAGVIRKEVEALIEAGAKIIQVDEPALSVRPEELSVAIEAMQRVTEGLPAYFLTHICYGAFEFVYPKMLKLPVDNFDLELSNSDLNLLALFKKHPFTKDISFGVEDVHSHKIETPKLIQERIKAAAKIIDPSKIWVDPDCGLKTRTVQEAREKLIALVKAVQPLRPTRNGHRS